MKLSQRHTLLSQSTVPGLFKDMAIAAQHVHALVVTSLVAALPACYA
jgi:hypothetical protein